VVIEYEPVVTIVVRSKKDRDAVLATLNSHFKQYHEWWRIEVATLHGTRELEKARKILHEMVEVKPWRYYVVLLGKEDGLSGIDEILPDNVVSVTLPRAKVRNCRPSMIFRYFMKALSLIRLRISWIEDHYVLGKCLRGTKVPVQPHPLHDMYFAIGQRHVERWSRLLGVEIRAIPLIVKLIHDVHEVYVGSVRVGSVIIPDVDVSRVLEVCHRVEDVSHVFEKTIEVNRDKMEIHEEIAVHLLRSVAESYDYDRVIVPWSGGKDSTAALVLALKVFSRDHVVPIFVDTGVEIDEVYKYVNDVAKILGISYEVEYAGIDVEWERRGFELPTHENRWCTKLKIAALYRAIKKVAERPLIVVGDRDTESLLRLFRPPVRPHGNYVQVAPIKFWSTAMVQLYLLQNGVPLNPLYLEGFYRIGCYICPAYRCWELDIAEEYFKSRSS